MMRKHDCT